MATGQIYRDRQGHIPSFPPQERSEPNEFNEAGFVLRTSRSRPVGMTVHG